MWECISFVNQCETAWILTLINTNTTFLLRFILLFHIFIFFFSRLKPVYEICHGDHSALQKPGKLIYFSRRLLKDTVETRYLHPLHKKTLLAASVGVFTRSSAFVLHANISHQKHTHLWDLNGTGYHDVYPRGCRPVGEPKPPLIRLLFSYLRVIAGLKSTLRCHTPDPLRSQWNKTVNTSVTRWNLFGSATPAAWCESAPGPWPQQVNVYDWKAKVIRHEGNGVVCLLGNYDVKNELNLKRAAVDSKWNWRILCILPKK